MLLKVKTINWSAGLPVVILNNETALRMGVQLTDHILIQTLGSKPRKIHVIIDTLDTLVEKNQIVVSSEVKDILNLKTNQKVDVSLSPSSHSLPFIKKKLDNKKLTKKEIELIITEISQNILTEPEIALFVSAMYTHGMTLKETFYLIEALTKSGHSLNLKGKLIADKHCVGGIPGNRTTPLVVSICACAGLIMPKTSSRAITSAAGTADVIETIARVDFTIEETRKILKKVGAMMVWGGSLSMISADSKIIQVEKSLKIDPKAQLLASIMSKKLSVGSKYILIDIPYGQSAKVSRKKALNLKKQFLSIGKKFKRVIRVVLTDGSQPIGNGIGPALELIDIINILNPKTQGPKDLEEKSLLLAGELLEMTHKAKKGQGKNLAKEILYSGRAFKKFKEIIKAQEGSLSKLSEKNLKMSFKHKFIIKSTYSGEIKKIDNKSLSILAREAGCPQDKFSGVYLHVHKQDSVKKGDPLVTIYSNTSFRLNKAKEYYHRTKPILVSH